jgi:hypothetical protein
MKLSKLREQDEPIPSDVPPINNELESERRANEKLVQTMKKYKKDFIFWKVIKIPEGEIHNTIRIEDIPFTPERFKEGVLGEITCDIDFMPNMDQTPVIPTNLLTICMEDFVDSLININPDLRDKPSIFPTSLLNMYDIKIQRINIYPLKGIFSLKDMMENHVWNTKVSAPRPLGDILFSRSFLLSSYKLLPTDLPTFSDDYGPYMKKLLKKSYTVFLALRKGTWRGHTYELSDYEVKKSGFIVHQIHSSYNKQDKVLHPEFTIGANFGYEIVDGIKNSPSDSPLSDEEQKEFRSYLRIRFRNFGIDY